MAIKEYLSQDCPDFYNTIRRYIGEDKLVYGLLASIGSEPVRISESDGMEMEVMSTILSLYEEPNYVFVE
mgnify:CR=1 FL=1